MRHDHIEHHHSRPEPFTVKGNLAFVLKSFGLPEDMNEGAAEDAFSDDVARAFGLTGKSCVIIEWQCTSTDGEHTYEVKAMPVRTVSTHCNPCGTSHPPGCHQPKSDPWLVVGRTTIDGTLAQVKSCMEESDPDRDVESAIDAFVRAGAAGLPWMIGGRHMLARGSHINSHAGTALVRCDIVRRQSEITREQLSSAMIAEGATSEVAATGVRAFIAALQKPSCPECGPHGNMGKVAGFDTVYDCTTCAGGWPGDVHETQCDGRDDRGLSCAARLGGPEDCPKCYPGRGGV